MVRRHRGEVTDRSDREIARDEALRRSLHVLGGDGVDPLAKRCRGLALSICQNLAADVLHEDSTRFQVHQQGAFQLVTGTSDLFVGQCLRRDVVQRVAEDVNESGYVRSARRALDTHNAGMANIELNAVAESTQ